MLIKIINFQYNFIHILFIRPHRPADPGDAHQQQDKHYYRNQFFHRIIPFSAVIGGDGLQVF